MRDYRKEQFIGRFKNANISRTEAERKYKLKIEEEEELERRRIFEAMNAQAVQQALQSGGAVATGGTTIDNYSLLSDNILIYFKSETTSTYQVISFNYTDNKISGPTDLGIDSSWEFYSSHMIQGKGSLAYGVGGDNLWYAFLDVNANIIESEIVANPTQWDTNNNDGIGVSVDYTIDGITTLKWWTGDTPTINSHQITCDSITMNWFGNDDALSDSTLNGRDNNLNYWSFLTNGEVYNITDVVTGGGYAIESARIYAYGDFYQVLYEDVSGIYTNLRIISNKGVVLQDVDLTGEIYTRYNRGFYGNNKYYIRLSNNSDYSIPYYFIVYNGNTDTVITRIEPRGNNFYGGIVYRIEYNPGYQNDAKRDTYGDYIIFSTDDGAGAGYDGKMDTYTYVKFFALIGDSTEFIEYDHENDGEEIFKYRTDRISANYPSFVIKQEDSTYAKLMVFKPTGVEFHLTDIVYSEAENLGVSEIGDHIWIQYDNSASQFIKVYSTSGVLIDSLETTINNTNWDYRGETALVRDTSQGRSWYFGGVSGDTTPEFIETDSYLFNVETIDSCLNVTDGSEYSNFFAYGEGYQSETPAIIIGKDTVSEEITLSDSSSGNYSSWITPNYAVWLARPYDGNYLISVYALDGTLLQQTDLGITSTSNTYAIGDRILITSIVDEKYKMWMIKGSEIQYNESITESEYNNWLYTQSNDWNWNDC